MGYLAAQSDGKLQRASFPWLEWNHPISFLSLISKIIFTKETFYVSAAATLYDLKDTATLPLVSIVQFIPQIEQKPTDFPVVRGFIRIKEML